MIHEKDLAQHRKSTKAEKAINRINFYFDVHRRYRDFAQTEIELSEITDLDLNEDYLRKCDLIMNFCHKRILKASKDLVFPLHHSLEIMPF